MIRKLQMKKPTAGAWHAGKLGRYYYVLSKDGYVIACLNGAYQSHAAANARTMAAAPDMLKVIEDFRAWHAEHFADFSAEVNAQLLCLDNDAAAVLAKAGVS